MAFRATNIIPQIAYQKVRGAAANVKTNCSAFISQMAASGANYSFLRDIRVFLSNANASFTSLATTPGLADYAKAQENDPSYNIAAENRFRELFELEHSRDEAVARSLRALAELDKAIPDLPCETLREDVLHALPSPGMRALEEALQHHSEPRPRRP